MPPTICNLLTTLNTHVITLRMSSTVATQWPHGHRHHTVCGIMATDTASHKIKIQQLQFTNVLQIMNRMTTAAGCMYASFSHTRWQHQRVSCPKTAGGLTTGWGLERGRCPHPREYFRIFRSKMQGFMHFYNQTWSRGSIDPPGGLKMKNKIMRGLKI